MAADQNNGGDARKVLGDLTAPTSDFYGRTGHSTPTQDFPIEELKANKAHKENIEVPMNALLQFMDYEDHSSSDEEEETKEVQIAWYLGVLIKLISKLFGTETLEEEPPLLTKELNALVQQKLPQKLLDPERFLIPCTIGTINLEKMADKSMKKAFGLVEDVLVKVEDLYIPTDFTIMDTGEEKDEFIILGRPFLATANAIIDVAKGELILQLSEDHILFKMPNTNSSSDKRETVMQHLVFQPSLCVKLYRSPRHQF
ncbi:uncharacterized protein LOC130975253 [Arachis stenosperma]|uniref:uncharacterized protein LOC130975253 n=1 Tax=Arachis stenosperma TaxID=217475 RepID=UPI0025AB838A|nr:uncharacterized protein LOC130975253 [Arachis stenosperma]